MPQVNDQDERLNELVADFVTMINTDVYDGKLNTNTLKDGVYEFIVETVNKKKSILFLGEMMFSIPMVNGNIIADEDVSNYEVVDYGTYVDSLFLVVSGNDISLLEDIAEDYLTGSNDTGMNYHNLRCDSYFIDTDFDEEIFTKDQQKFYAENHDGKFVVFDDKCKFIYGCDTKAEVMTNFPTAKMMKCVAQIDTRGWESL